MRNLSLSYKGTHNPYHKSFYEKTPLVIDNMPKEEQKTISFFIGRNLAESEVPLLLITRKEIEYGVNIVSAAFANEKNQEPRLSSVKMFSTFVGRGLL